MEREFTLEELKKYDGKDGNRVYIAYEGTIYDMTDFPAWSTGVHKGPAKGGIDVTDILKNVSPHDPIIFEAKDIPVVGKLV